MPEHLSFEEQRAVDGAKLFLGDGNGYSRQQATRPQTIGYALSDSPAGQAMWIYESFTVGLTTTALLKTRCRGIRCWTTFHSTGSQTPRHRRHGSTGRTKAPHFQEASSPCLWPQPSSRKRYIVLQSWAEQTYSNLIYWNEAEHGGHFAAFEQPDIFVEEMRSAFRKLREQSGY
jgi:hypothetical protein